MTKYEYVLASIENLAKDKYGKARVVAAWNEKSLAQNYFNNVVYKNNEKFFREHFNDAWEAVRATTCGHWEFNDPYVVFNGYKNVDSFYYLDDEKSPICFQELADYIVDNEKYDCLLLTGFDSEDGTIAE